MAKHEELPIPIFSTIEPVYGDGIQLTEAQQRFDVLKSKFEQVFGHQPDLFTRSPGMCFFVLLIFMKFQCLQR